VIKEMSLESKRRGKNYREKLFHALITMKPKSVEPEKAFLATELFVTKLKQTE